MKIKDTFKGKLIEVTKERITDFGLMDVPILSLLYRENFPVPFLQAFCNYSVKLVSSHFFFFLI